MAPAAGTVSLGGQCGIGREDGKSLVAGTVSLGGQCGNGREDGKSLVAMVANSFREKLVPSAT
jgi:hypothetical protein